MRATECAPILPGNRRLPIDQPCQSSPPVIVPVRNVISPGHFREAIRGFICGTRCAPWNQQAVQTIGCCCPRREDSFVADSHFASRSCPYPPVLETQMTLSMTHLQPIVALIAGVLILIMPRLLNFIVAIYLILVGIIGLGIIK